MKKLHAGIKQKSKKIVRLRMDAGFYFERAVHYLDRHRYDKAVKYFRLATEKEPDNPVNHCNLAGILSELGRFEESNEVLRKVLDEVDPELYECLFYLANNAANMGDLEQAEEHLLAYLSFDPHGDFAEEAEEMLYMIAQELGRPPKEWMPANLPDFVRAHEQARNYLEEGRFLQAIELLEEISRNHPEFLAARNNLALAYYYTGKLEQAMQLIGQVLEIDPNNLHALCNLAVLSQHMGEKEKGQKIIGMLKKLVPFHQEHTYKLATTLGILGEHEVAYELFSRLLKTGGIQETVLYHYTAVSAWNSGRYDKARFYWKKAMKLESKAGVAAFYYQHMDQWLELDHPPVINYHYQLPFEEQLNRMDLFNPSEDIIKQLQSNLLLRSTFFWALSRGDRQTKKQVLKFLIWIADDEVKQLLEQFVSQPEEDKELKELAQIILQALNEQKVESLDRPAGPPIIEVNKKWERVLECCLEHVKASMAHLHKEIERLWFEWAARNSDFSMIRKIEGWAAALEYLTAKYHGVTVTQRELAEKYQVSMSTVSRLAKQLDTIAKECFS
ncbi:MAG: tetratricopeptide repeat protein [Thermoactinomyces sp.]